MPRIDAIIAQAAEDAVRRKEELDKRWKIDPELVGKILRGHLVVEHFMAEYLQAANPRLGSVASAGLRFTQKLELLSRDEYRISDLIPGLRLINKLRNKFAHQLDYVLTDEDVKPLKQHASWWALVMALENPPSQPTDLYSSFCRFAAALLQTAEEHHASRTLYSTYVSTFAEPDASSVAVPEDDT